MPIVYAAHDLEEKKINLNAEEDRTMGRKMEMTISAGKW